MIYFSNGTANAREHYINARLDYTIQKVNKDGGGAINALIEIDDHEINIVNIYHLVQTQKEKLSILN